MDPFMQLIILSVLYFLSFITWFPKILLLIPLGKSKGVCVYVCLCIFNSDEQGSWFYLIKKLQVL